MLRANRLKTVNKDIFHWTVFDKWIQDFGGCTYSNCYTPAPDTPRSLACFYTGLYPKLNGCRSRIEWPKYYQNQNKSTIFELLNDSKYDIYTNFSRYELEVGVLSNKDLKFVSNFNSFLDVFNSNVIENKDKNSCFFLTLNDYHQCVEDYSSLKRADKKGHEKLIDAFNLFFGKYDKDTFDYIFIFSDHGCVLSDDYSDSRKKYFLLNDNRSKVFLHMRKKGDNNYRINQSLRSVMDIYPSIAEILDKVVPNNINGSSLFNTNPHKFIVVEDSSSFKPVLGSYNDIWRYKENDFSYYLSVDQGEELKYENFKNSNNLNNKVFVNKIIDIVSEYSCSFKEIKKRNDILSSYEELRRQYSTMEFSSGEKRNHNLKIYFYKFFALSLKILKNIHFNIFRFSKKSRNY